MFFFASATSFSKRVRSAMDQITTGFERLN